MFYCYFDNNQIDLESLYNRNQIMVIANSELIKLYNKYKEIKIINSNKWNQLYKKSKYEQINNTKNFMQNLLCETCPINFSCDGIVCSMFPDNILKEKTYQEEYKINLHILEPCNFRCKHCFAHFDNHNILPLNYWKHIVDNCMNAIFVNEFNIAGGEPLLYKDLSLLIDYIYSLQIKCSIITNGFLMDEEWIKNNAPKLNTIGFSIDSFIPNILFQIGRKTNKKEYLSKEKFTQLCKWIKKYNPDCKIKLNTVVTSLNKNENLLSEIKKLPIDKWKIIKMRVFKNNNFDNSNIKISDQEYIEFVNINTKNAEYVSKGQKDSDSDILKINNTTIVIEKSTEAGYIIIDANGYLVDNSKNDNYEVLINCATEEFLDGFKKLSLDKNLYFSRYKI